MSTSARSSGDASKPPRMPVLFLGHGNPMNAIEDNVWSRGFRDLARALPRPKAVLAVSAHWYVDGTFTTANERPKTIHDFGGFPDALFRVQYPAPGDPDLARRVVELLGEPRASVDSTWGLDHGTWSVLVHLLPAADVPVVQLSIDGRLPPAEHLAIGRALAPLRDEGVLVLGSGNLVHNLRHAFGAWHRGETQTPVWAREFDLGIARALERHEADHLVRALESDAGRLSHPTPDHYLPLLYAPARARSTTPSASRSRDSTWPRSPCAPWCSDERRLLPLSLREATVTAALSRVPEHSIDPLFHERWSPPAFTGEEISVEALMGLFEAAHWAPSANNAQP